MASRGARTWPALGVSFGSAVPSDVGDRVLALLDDYQPSGLDECAPHEWRVFFGSTEARDAALAGLRLGLDPESVNFQALDVPDENWAERSQTHLGPVTVGRLVVTPPWAAQRSEPAAAGTCQIVIQPSMGFGTAHHASTRLCLDLLQRAPLQGRSVIDVGTGSGVLAIAACVLGASRVLALDHDVDALDAARENLILNGVEHQVDLRLGDLAEGIPRSGFLVLANLNGATLARHAAALRGAAEEYLILGGLLADEEATVLSACHDAELVERVAEDEWLALCLAVDHPRDRPTPTAARQRR